MKNVYAVLDMLLPFSFMHYDFMKNAFLAAVLLAPLFALLGTMAVNNKMAFFSDALGHSAFTGIGIGVLLGMKDPIASMVAFGILLSLAITKVKSANTASSDTIISVFSSTAMAVGIVILSKNGGFSKFSNYLIGDILTVQPDDIWLILILLIMAYIIWANIYNSLLLLSINESLAVSRGVRAKWIENIFVVMVAVVVMVSIQWIGILTINSLLILPAAAARNISKNVRQYHWMTVILGMISSVGGLFFSYYMGTSAGATMVFIAAILFFITYGLRMYRR